MIKILPLCTPPVAGYTYHAFPLSVILLNENAFPWFYSNYIQLQISLREEDIYFTDFYSYARRDPGLYPFLHTNKFHRDLYSSKKKFVHFLQEAVSHGHYVYMFVDEYEINGRQQHLKNHLTHDILIHGVDSENESCHVSGFNQNVVFDRWEIPIQSLFSGFRHAKVLQDQHQYICLFQNDFTYGYRFQMKNMLALLQDYMSGTNTSERLSMHVNAYSSNDYIFGHRVYDKVFEYLEAVRRHQYKLSIMPFHILWEHKRTMRQRFEYIDVADLEHWYEPLRDLEQLAYSIRNRFLKYLVSQKSGEWAKARAQLEELKERERKAMHGIIDELLIRLG
ncbi:hypothetical protein [Cohnella soli]|uniref:Uncharacterized protein n=1 Tax=Cohnella soli TaxID=425005 RepID=A0ABW0I4A2_9BACL